MKRFFTLLVIGTAILVRGADGRRARANPRKEGKLR